MNVHTALQVLGALALLFIIPGRFVLAEPPNPLGPIPSLLVIESLGQGGRAPVATDPIEYALALGTFTPPKEGDSVAPPSAAAPNAAPKTWRRLNASPEGDFSDPALRGGWAFASVTSPDNRVVLLEASGHRHVYVNGIPRAGDVYSLGIVRIPVELRAGENHFLFRAGRGGLRARLIEAPAALYIEDRDRTIPDAIRADPEHPNAAETAPLVAGVIVGNASKSWVRGAVIVSKGPDQALVISPVPDLPPESIRKVPVTLNHPEAGPPKGVEPAGNAAAYTLELRAADGAVSHEASLSVNRRASSELHTRTFRSSIDGSVQYYTVMPPPRDAPPGPKALVLSLHGASVEASGQAASYSPKPWCYIVAPTNRRPFGFDWEDWGRLDAIEVLEDAMRRYPIDPARVSVTGHSMGGHGAWQLGVLFPDRFAAVAPSAGWSDFWSYGGAAAWPNPTPVQALLSRAANASRTLQFERNLTERAVYILHGDADDNVPVQQARTMRARLAEFHPRFAYHEQPGAGHWWGGECVDWPPLMQMIERARRPDDAAVLRVRFVTPSPGVSARLHWVTIEAQQRWLEASEIDAALAPGTRAFTVTTKNVERFAIDLGPLARERPGAAPNQPGAPTLLAGDPVKMTIDGQELGAVTWPDLPSIPNAPGPFLRFTRDPAGAWTTRWGAPGDKSPARAGPFKDAFRHRMMFVVGTRGNDDENALALHKARFDAETFWYRGNGSIDLCTDAEFLDRADTEGRNVILYGNADTNAAWGALLSESPIEVRRSGVRVGVQTLNGSDLACLLVRPRHGPGNASVGVVGGTGLVGMRATTQLPYFLSGVGYPDWIVVSAATFDVGTPGIRALGFFDTGWNIRSEDSASSP